MILLSFTLLQACNANLEEYVKEAVTEPVATPEPLPAAPTTPTGETFSIKWSPGTTRSAATTIGARITTTPTYHSATATTVGAKLSLSKARVSQQ